MSSPDNLNAYLQEYPWKPEETQGRRTLDSIWKFELEGTPTDYWPFLIDTSYFNKLLGLPEMQYTEKNGILYGTSVNAGFHLAWREVPWEWDYLKSLNNARVYSKGFAHYVRVRYLFDVSTSGNLNFIVYFGWVPTNFGTFLLLKTGMKKLHANYLKALKKIEKVITSKQQMAERQKELLLLTDKHILSAEALLILEEMQKAIIKLGASPECLERLVHFIKTASNEEIIRLRPLQLSQIWELDENIVLKTFLLSAKAGLVNISWDVTCPHCRGVRESVNTLGDIQEASKCDVCEITFSTQDKEIIEVIFHINPAIRKSEQKFFCAAEPATKRHILIQKRMPALSVLDLDTALDKGTYRLRFKGMKSAALVNVNEAGQKEVLFSGKSENINAAVYPHIKSENTEKQETMLVIEKDESDNTALRPARLFSFQYFRDIFVAEGLAAGLKIEAGVQNIVFTDVVSSTKMYKNAGDAQAFATVRAHFVKIYDVVRSHNGAVIKTIGDATMIAFSDTTNAMKACLAIQKLFDGKDKLCPVYLRVSLHKGSCLAVNLNSSIDYFGNTVNFAAKIQFAAGARQIVFSREVSEDTRIPLLLSENSLVVEKLKLKQSWSETLIPALRVTVA